MTMPLSISDHQRSVAPAPSKGLPHTSALLVVADSLIFQFYSKYLQIILHDTQRVVDFMDIFSGHCK